MRWQHVAVHLDERGRRLFAANEALGWHYGGVTATAEATGLARSTINRGIRELRSSRSEIAGRIRRPGGGNERCRRSTSRVTISTASGTIPSRLTNNLPDAVISRRALRPSKQRVSGNERCADILRAFPLSRYILPLLDGRGPSLVAGYRASSG